MSKETSLRADEKRKKIQSILESIFLECAAHNEKPEDFLHTMNAHIFLIKMKLPAQERHFTLSAWVEVKQSIRAFKNNPYLEVLERVKA